MSPSEAPVLLFDGVCNLCSAAVQWVLRHDRQGRFRFASLQGAHARKLLEGTELQNTPLQSVLLYVDGRLLSRSDAILELMRLLGPPWSVFLVFKILPRRLRDALYDFLARRRYQWFGKKEECWLPRPEWQDRFLD